jgi:hybrid cluster-associated redox disulfide protein
MKKVKKITKDMTISEMIEENPDAAEILMEQGLGCGGCPVSQMETIEQGALGHGMDPDELIKELNRK